ncbi:hypothetical protein HY572_01260 [Candidatus Micrarchaeota archaeon]|nr:hypothetical protein [Candidatus Micrarchaeota archaeon]
MAAVREELALKPKSPTHGFESNRQWFHILFGGGLLAVALFLGPTHALYGYAAALFLGLTILHLKLCGYALPFVDSALTQYERKNVLFPGQGALMYFAGTLFLLAFVPFDFALAVIAIVAFGDGFATLVGLHGIHGLPWNKKKKWEGLAAFIFSASAIASLVVPLAPAVFYAVVLGALETLAWRTDDNVLLPVAATILFHVVGV